MDHLSIARAIHVLALIHWLGGVAFVSCVILPLVLSLKNSKRRLALFEAVEQRFSRQVKISVALVGASGLYMSWRLEAWHRFIDLSAWWMMAMALVWAIFAVVLFIAEPLLLHAWFHRQASERPNDAFQRVTRAHWILLTAAFATAGAAVLGAHGFLG